MLKTILRRAMIGFSIGILLGDVIAMMSGSLSAEELVLVSDELMDTTGNLAIAFLIQTLVSGLYGAIVFGTTVFYDIEKWSLVLATAFHCLTVIGLFVPISLFLGWGGDDPITLLIMIGCQIVAFFIIWLIMNAIYKKQVKELNEMQKLLLQKQKPMG